MDEWAPPAFGHLPGAQETSARPCGAVTGLSSGRDQADPRPAVSASCLRVDESLPCSHSGQDTFSQVPPDPPSVAVHGCVPWGPGAGGQDALICAPACRLNPVQTLLPFLPARRQPSRRRAGATGESVLTSPAMRGVRKGRALPWGAGPRGFTRGRTGPQALPTDSPPGALVTRAHGMLCEMGSPCFVSPQCHSSSLGPFYVCVAVWVKKQPI